MTADRAALASEAFIYGFPLVFDLEQVVRFTEHGLGAVPAVPFNVFGHATELAGPGDRFVTINNDTVYSVAQVDLGGGPVRLEVPDAAGRYYVLQLVDAWTDNFAYVGHRATGTAAGAFLLAGPGGEPESPGDATVIRCPTTVVTIVGRWAVAGADDLPAVRALQQGLRLTETAPGRGVPRPDPAAAPELAFLEQLRTGMAAFPPATRDRAYQERFAPIGLLEAGPTPYAGPDPELAAGLADGRARLEAEIRDPSSAESQNGWRPAYHGFDYNLDHFAIGTRDDAEWKMADTPARYLARAAAARGGLWGNHGYEAAYAMVYVDEHGEPLDGGRRYALRFAQEPPCGAFWSVTMYDAEDFFLVDNPLGRYSIGDRTPGLRTDADGALTVLIQHEEPAGADAANWLPAPKGRFRPVLRMYEPDEAVFDGRYVLPPIARVA